MARRRRRAKKTAEKKGTNWLVIGGIGLIGIVALFGLLYLAIRGPEAQQRTSLAEYCQANEERCVAIGATDAPVTLVEVSDFGCPHCKAFHQEKSDPIKERYVDTGQVKWVFLPYALRPETTPAANAALCANEQSKYLEFSDALFDQPVETALSRDGFITAGEEVGLDIDSFASCLEDGRYNNVIGANQQVARAARVTGTPTFFVNERTISGNRPLEEFERIFSESIGS